MGSKHPNKIPFNFDYKVTVLQRSHCLRTIVSENINELQALTFYPFSIALREEETNVCDA